MDNQNYLEQLPQAAVEVRDGRVCAMNARARSQLPQLAQGAALPTELTDSLAGGAAVGSFVQGERQFVFTRLSSPSRELLLFRPQGDSSLTAGQLDGFSRQMREQMGSFLNRLQLLATELEDEPKSAPQLAGLSQSFYRMLRLVNNLDFLNLSQREREARYHPVIMDLAGMCRQLCRQAAPMLRPAGVSLEYREECTGLLISGDSRLLQRLLLGLISNAAKADPKGTVRLELKVRLDRALLLVSDGSVEPGDLSALNGVDADRGIPGPEEGAGMGLAVARQIAQLHGSALLCRRGPEGGLVFMLSLPTVTGMPPLPLNSPMEEDGGLSPILLELAELLPSQLFQPDTD